MARVPADTVCVLSVNDEGPTLKRLRYKEPPPGSDASWVLEVWADNPDFTHEATGPRAYYMKATARLTVHARAVAVGIVEDQ